MIETVPPQPLTLPDGRVLDVYVGGPENGTMLLAHHGTPSSGIPMRSSVDEAAARGLRWVSYSRPGYGDSTRMAGRSVADCVRDAAAIADHVGADRFFTLGTSGGGPHTLACAALLPERVRGCAAIASPAPWGAEGLDWLAGQAPENVEEWGAALAGPDALEAYLGREVVGLGSVASPQDIFDSFGELLPPVDRASVTGEYAETLIASTRRSVEHGIWGWFDDDMAFVDDWGFALGDIDVPIAIWQGAQDTMVPFAHGGWLAEHVSGSRAHLYDEHGHLSLRVAHFGAILDDLLEHAA